MGEQWRDGALCERLVKKRLVASVKEPRNIEKAIKYKEHLSAVLLMTGTILTVKRYVDYFQGQGLPVILHVDKIGGLEMDRDGIEFIKRNVKPAAIVTTKTGVIKKAKASGLFVIQRVFMIDSDVFKNLIKEANHIIADVIEIMPCRAPDYIKTLTNVMPVPVITGGLLSMQEQAEEALESGATAITTSNTDIWKVDFSN